MLIASNPQLVDAIYNLSVNVLDKCVAVTGKDDNLTASITNYANYIGGRQVWDLKPYMEKLRARYLTK